MRRAGTRDVLAALVGVSLGFAAIAALTVSEVGSQGSEEARIRKAFARPTSLPVPSGSLLSPGMVALGERLFSDPRLSANGRVACATCHDVRLGLADGVRSSTAGVTAKPLARHTPTLWNVAWVPLLMWDGRANGLEQQAALPMSHPDEMASSPAQAAGRLAADPEMRRQFAAAFPEAPEVTAANLVAALAAFERTLVSPPTRFDEWVAGNAGALSDEERLGLSLFVGKAGCVNCHTGFAFSDHAFHDIGLPTDDMGRGPVAGIAAVNRAFKTPTLRELAWTAPYMHDGSIETLEDVVRHYEGGGINRKTRSREMPRRLTLSDDERAALVAFLETLSSESPPQSSREPWVRSASPARADETLVAATTIQQKGRQFSPAAIRVKRGDTITILNDDTRTHNVRIASPELDYNSGAQEPGESVVLRLDRTGRFEAHCSIHPTMHLSITVE